MFHRYLFIQHIAAKYEAIRDGVRSIMGGKVFAYEAKTIWNESWNRG